MMVAIDEHLDGALVEELDLDQLRALAAEDDPELHRGEVVAVDELIARREESRRR